MKVALSLLVLAACASAAPLKEPPITAETLLAIANDMRIQRAIIGRQHEEIEKLTARIVQIELSCMNVLVL